MTTITKINVSADSSAKGVDYIYNGLDDNGDVVDTYISKGWSDHADALSMFICKGYEVSIKF